MRNEILGLLRGAKHGMHSEAPFAHIVANGMVTENTPAAPLLSQYHRTKPVAAFVKGRRRKRTRITEMVGKNRWMLLNVIGDNITGDKLEIGVDSRPLSAERLKFGPQKATTDSPKSRPGLPEYLQVGAIREFSRHNQTRLGRETR